MIRINHTREWYHSAGINRFSLAPSHPNEFKTRFDKADFGGMIVYEVKLVLVKALTIQTCGDWVVFLLIPAKLTH